MRNEVGLFCAMERAKASLRRAYVAINLEDVIANVELHHKYIVEVATMLDDGDVLRIAET